jgi:Zn-finger nucleic acid-binding protein
MALSCPCCPASSLREFHDRYVCDTCNGMLIRADDFVAAIHEIDGASDPLAFQGSVDAGVACPSCALGMKRSKATIGALELADPIMHCERDGLWVARDALTAAFARVSRRERMRRGPGLSRIDGGVYAPVTSGGIAAAMSSIHEAFTSRTPATSGLAISQWQSARPRVHTLFVSTYKERRLGCPSCKEAALDYRGDRWDCRTCAGSFVENAALSAMVTDMTNSPWELPIVEGKPGERECPVCAAPMLVEVLEAVTSDRCASHGVWFDAHELQDALHHASTGEPTSVGGWLKRLFHRHGKVDDDVRDS